MNIKNLSSQTLYVNGVDVQLRQLELPNDFSGTLLVGTEPLTFSDSTQEILVTDSGTGLVIEDIQMTAPPITEAVCLMLVVMGFHLLVRIVQKVRTA